MPEQTPKAPAADLVQSMLQDTKRLQQAAEAILFEEAKRHPDSGDRVLISPDKRSVLRMAGIEKDDVIPEVNRMRRVLRHMAAAGTSEDLAAAETELGAAQSELKSESGALREAIEAAQNTLAALEARATNAAQELERLQSARQTLRSSKLLPQFLQDELRSARASLDPLAQTRAEARNELNRAEAIASAHEPDEQKRIAQTLKLDALRAERHPETGVRRTVVDDSKFAAHAADARAALPKLRAKVERLDAELNAAEVEAGADLRDYYLNQLD